MLRLIGAKAMSCVERDAARLSRTAQMHADMMRQQSGHTFTKTELIHERIELAGTKKKMAERAHFSAWRKSERLFCDMPRAKPKTRRLAGADNIYRRRFGFKRTLGRNRRA